MAKLTVILKARPAWALASAVIDSAGAITVYNGHSSAAVVYIHGIYPNA